MKSFLVKHYKTNGFSSSNMTKETEKTRNIRKTKKKNSGPPPCPSGTPSPYVLKGPNRKTIRKWGPKHFLIVFLLPDALALCFKGLNRKQ